jgi:hypothetical protein
MYIPKINAFEFKRSYEIKERLILEEYIQISAP